MSEHNDLGKKGEQLAQEYHISKGYKIRHTNWRFGKCELDIVAEKDGFLVVVEVKTRSTDYFGHPTEAINHKKIRRIVYATQSYIVAYNWNMETRFDVISILPDSHGNYNIEHIENAFCCPIL
jgi:putative endonuclease